MVYNIGINKHNNFDSEAFKQRSDIMSKFPKIINRAAIAAVLCLSIGTCTLPTATAEAFDVGGSLGTIINLGAQYAYLDKQLNYIDNSGRNEYMQQVKDKYGVDETERANTMLTSVMSRLSDSIAVTDPSIKKKPYNYFVNKDTSFNAFCTVGHNMSVNIGLFDKLNYNENEIAFVVAHEMGHGEKGHAIKGVRKSFPIDLLTSLYASQNPAAAAQIGAKLASQIGTAKLVTKPMEVEADEVAFGYAVGAGYNIGAGAAVWQRVLDRIDTSSSSGVSDLFNDHPTNISRRDKYNTKMSAWSGNVVKVDAKTGSITIRGKEFYKPADTTDMSGKEQAYLIAGNLSAVYHNTSKPAGNVWTSEDNLLYVGEQPIMSLNGVANASELQAKLQQLL